MYNFSRSGEVIVVVIDVWPLWDVSSITVKSNDSDAKTRDSEAKADYFEATVVEHQLGIYNGSY